jgi:hypothetical protein
MVGQTLYDRPTRIFELIPSPPQVIGTTDASGSGFGGTFFVPTEQSTPSESSCRSYVWRYRLPDDVRSKLITETNPTGSITNSNLELAAAVVHTDVVAMQYDITETTVASLHDNTPTVFWQRRGSTTHTNPAAYLLRLHALHVRQFRYISTHDYIPGHINMMADYASRSFDHTPKVFLTYFNSVFPQPYPWIECTPRFEMISSVTFALFKKRSKPELLPHGPPKPPIHGNCGWNSVTSTNSTHGSRPTQTQYHTSKYSDNALETADSPKPVRASTVADTIRMVGQTYMQLGTRDIRLDKLTGQSDFRLQRQPKAFEKQDPATTRVKPIPFQLVHHTVTTAHKHGQHSNATHATADMIRIAFFFYSDQESTRIPKTAPHSDSKMYCSTPDKGNSDPTRYHQWNSTL